MVFSELQVLLSHLWEKEKKKKRKREGKKGIEKERKEEGIKKERRTERKKEFKGKGGEEKKSLLLALNWSG